jgi:hypothetical protein
MSRPIALTPHQLRRVRRWKAARHEIIKQLKSLPTRAELAAELNCSERTIGRAISEEERKRAPRMVSIWELLT